MPTIIDIAGLSGSVFGEGEPEARPSSVYINDEDIVVDFNVVEVILVQFDENLKFWSGFGPTGRFLGVD